nr:M56 family metallopeptidase [Auraticoccus cholistanensis]
MVITVVESERALACALPGRLPGGSGARHRVVVSSGLARALTPAELRAVMQHELAHLRLHHPVLVRLARLNAACLPLLPGARELHRVTGLLVELIADDAAARRCGSAPLARALTTIGTREGDESMLLRAERLRRSPVPPPRPRRPLLWSPQRATAAGR